MSTTTDLEDKQAVADLLSRLPLAEKLELLRGVLPEVRHDVESGDEPGIVEHSWMPESAVRRRVERSCLTLVYYDPSLAANPEDFEPWDSENCNIWATVEGLRQMAACCLAAAAELGGCDE